MKRTRSEAGRPVGCAMIKEDVAKRVELTMQHQR